MNRKFVFFAFISMAAFGNTAGIPEGWRTVNSQDVKTSDPTVSLDLSQFVLKADFDGNSTQDEARIFISTAGLAGIFVYFGQNETNPVFVHEFNDLDSRDLLARPKLRFTLAPKRSKWSHSCKDDYSGPLTIELLNTGIMFEHEDPGGDPDYFYGPYIFYWSTKLKKFQRYETC